MECLKALSIPEEIVDDEGAPRVFVANEDGTYFCEGCIPPSIDVGSDDVVTWLEGTNGWLTPIKCCACGRAVDIVVDGEEE
jgi:hypothetical protein